MKCRKSAIVDLDGIVWRSNKIIGENVEALRKLIDAGINTVFLTNNSTRCRKEYSIKLSSILNREIPENMIINSGYSAAVWLSRHHPHSKLLVVGENGLVTELVKAGHTVLAIDSWKQADAVVVGLDRSLTYTKVAYAHKAILNGALFIATNSDSSFPDETSTIPGAGSIVSMLIASTGKKPDIDAGKPNKWILDLALETLHTTIDNTVIIGDRLDTDMKMAEENGILGLLVLTGVTQELSQTSKSIIVVNNLLEAVEKGIFCI